MYRLDAGLPTPRQTAPCTRRRSAVALLLCIATIASLYAAPARAQGQNNRRVVEGTLEALYEDGPTSARLTHFINTGTERIPVRFQDRLPLHVLHGSRVRATGTMNAGVLELSSGSGTSSPSGSSSFTPLTLASSRSIQR